MTRPNVLRRPRAARKTFQLEHTRELVREIFIDEEIHAKRVQSLGNGVVGVLNAARLSVHAIGQGYAAVAEILPKSAINMTNRLLENSGLQLPQLMGGWVRHVVGGAQNIVIALDWTDFENDDQTTLCGYLVTRKGRSLPLAWRTVKKSALKGKQVQWETELIQDLHAWLPPEVKITLLADRGFGNQEHYRLLESLHWDYVIRFRECILVEAADGESRPAAKWVPGQGRALKLPRARVTADRTEIGAVVCVKRAGMKEAWTLATSLTDAAANEVVTLYSKRFTIEETFRDTKDLTFGMGLRATHVGTGARRDRMLLLVAIAYSLLTLLGAASEACGMDRYLKANTVKRRTHSLFRQGEYWYSCIPNMREDWLRNLMFAYDEILLRDADLASILGFANPAIMT